VRCATLDTAPGCRDEAFYSGGIQTPGELLLLGFDAGDDWDGEKVFVDLTIKFEDLVDFDIGLCFSEVCGVTLLPQVLACAEKGFWWTLVADLKNFSLAYEDS